MWTCVKCKRVFGKANQQHSCRSVPLEEHFVGKDKAKELFDYLVEQLNSKVGKCQVVSIPCCIHLFGKYDFLAVLPKKYGLEIRFALDRMLESSFLKQAVQTSMHVFKNCFEIKSKQDIDSRLIGLIVEAYNFNN